MIYVQSLHDAEQALADFSQAIALKPDYAEALTNRGVIYAQQGQYTRAINDLTEAIRIRPDLADAYVARGNAYVGKQQSSLSLRRPSYEQAIADYDKAISLNPASALAYFQKGAACEQAGQSAEALAAYRKFVELNDPQYAQFMGYVKGRIRDLEKKARP